MFKWIANYIWLLIPCGIGGGILWYNLKEHGLVSVLCGLFVIVLYIGTQTNGFKRF